MTVTVTLDANPPTVAPVRPPQSLVSYMFAHRRSVAIGAFFLLLTNGIERAIPWLLKIGVDAFSAAAPERVRGCALWVVALAAAMMVTRTLSRIFVFNVGREIELTLRDELLAALHRLGSSFFMRAKTGDIMSRATNDLAQVRLLVGFGTLNVVNAVLAWVSALALMLTLSPRLTFYALLPYPLFALLTRYFIRSLYTISQENQQALGKLAERAQEYLSGVRVVRVFAAGAYERERFAEVNRDAVARAMKLVSLRALMTPVLLGVSAIGTLLVIYMGGTMISEGQLTKGELVAFYAYLAQLVWPTMAAGYILSILQRGRAAYARVREILDAPADVVEAAEPLPYQAAQPSVGGRGALRVSGLSFSYDGRSVLKDISFEVPAATSLAIVGQTGSGKSTLSALLSRLLPTPAGSVFLDGHDVTQLPLDELRKAITYAPQEPFLFSTTIARNIGFSLAEVENADDSQGVRKAAELAAVCEEIERLHDGFDTVVGERGVQLSGGQKQRVALARALLNDPAVLILDDPLSAVDAKTEHAILEALDHAAEGRTLVLVTGRVAAAARCDRVVVLHQGEVVEHGTHADLLARGGRYAKLCRQQSLERELLAS